MKVSFCSHCFRSWLWSQRLRDGLHVWEMYSNKVTIHVLLCCHQAKFRFWLRRETQESETLQGEGLAIPVSSNCHMRSCSRVVQGSCCMVLQLQRYPSMSILINQLRCGTGT